MTGVRRRAAVILAAGTIRNPLFHAEVRFAGESTNPIEIGLAQSLIDLIQLKGRKRLGRARFEAARVRVVGAVVHFAGQVRLDYFDLLAARNILARQETVMKAQEAAAGLALRQHGTQMYHPHFDEMVQQSMGMMGLLIFHPRNPRRRIDRDFGIFLNEWFIKPGTSTPDPTVMLDFNVFTFNSRVFPATAPLITVTRSDGRRATAVPYRPRPGSRRRPSTSRRAPRATWSSWPTTPATGRCTATRSTTP